MSPIQWAVASSAATYYDGCYRQRVHRRVWCLTMQQPIPQNKNHENLEGLTGGCEALRHPEPEDHFPS